MPSRVAAVARSAGLILILASAAACAGSSGGPSPSAPVDTPGLTSAAVASPGDTAEPTDPTDASLGPTTSPPGSPDLSSDSPPDAMLDGLSGPAAQGELGTYTWGDVGSDAPWIVGDPAGTARAGSTLVVDFLQPAEASGWHARWARVTAGQAGDSSVGEDGAEAPMELAAPSEPGAWSLQLTASFGDGHTATWYWQVEVR
jgi:hypothetical protein